MSSVQKFVEAFRILKSGFPNYGNYEFERAKALLGTMVSEDMAQAIVSDTILVLSQFGPAFLNGLSEAASPKETAMLNAIRHIQNGDLRQATRFLAADLGRVGTAQMLPLQVLAKRLGAAGIRLTDRPILRVIDGRSAPPLPRHAPTLRLVSSRSLT